MLAAAALTDFVELEKQFAPLPETQGVTDTASLITTEYLRFVRENPARFEAMFALAVDKTQHQDLLQQTFQVQERFEASLSLHLPPAETTCRAAELWSLTHGIT